MVISRCDGIGRRAGLKIRSWRQGAGSTPATGTKKRLAQASLFYYHFHLSAEYLIITAAGDSFILSVIPASISSLPDFLTAKFGLSKSVTV